jgi:hypothetical protein
MNSTSGYMKVNALTSSSIYGLEDAKCGKHLDVFSRKKTTQKDNISLRILGFLHFSGKNSTPVIFRWWNIKILKCNNTH